MVAALAMWRTADALLILAAFVPLAGAVHAIAAPPCDSTALLEAFVLTVLAAAAARAAGSGAPLLSSRFDIAAAGLICFVLASCVALLPTMLLRAGSADWVETLSAFALRDYFLRPAPFVAIERTAVMVEGLALAVLVARVVRGPDLILRLSTMVVIGGAAAAALNVYRLVEIAMRRPSFLEGIVWSLQTQRFNTQDGDLNAAGSYFAMVTVLACCHAGFRTRREWMHAAAVPLLGCALWVSGSRVALVATLLTTATVVFLRSSAGVPAWLKARRNLAAVAGLLAVAFGLLLFLLPVTRHSSFMYSVTTRMELLKTGVQMVVDRPVFGVGPGQFYALFPHYATSKLQQTFAESLGYTVQRENAHNQFLQVLAELGIVGFISFMAVVALAMRSGGRLESRRGLIAALGAFLLTSLAGHPLLTPVVSFSFWIVIGLAAAAAPAGRDDAVRPMAWGLAATVLLLTVSMSSRWATERREADLADVTIGLGQWQRDAEGVRFQAASRRATLFISRDSPDVHIPLRSPDQQPRRVQILLDGETVAGVRVMPDRWLDVRLPLLHAARAPAFRRIDLVVEGNYAVDGGGGAEGLMVGRAVDRLP